MVKSFKKVEVNSTCFLLLQAPNSTSAHPTTQLSTTTTSSQNIIVLNESESKVLLSPPPLTPSQIRTTTAAETKKSAPASVLVRIPPHIPPAIPASIAAPDAHVPSALPVPSRIHSRANSTSSTMHIPSIPTPAIVTSPNASSPPSFVGSAKQVCINVDRTTVHNTVVLLRAIK